MATPYNPWQYSGQENVLEEGFAIKSYQEQSDLAEDLAEGESDAPESPEMEDVGENPMQSAMAQALTTISQQSEIINKLMSMVAPQE